MNARMALSGEASPACSTAPAGRTYSAVAIALHWLLAAALAAQVALGWWMQDVPKSPPGLRAGWFNLHKSVGLTLALVIVLRLAWRVTNAVDESPALPGWQRTLAQATHGMLYACMAAMPVTGLLGSLFTRYPVRVWGAVLALPHRDWPAGKQLMADLHAAFAWAFVVLVAAHVLAAAWHWWQRDGVAARMGIPDFR